MDSKVDLSLYKCISGYSDSWYLASQTCFNCKSLLCSIVGTTCDVSVCNTANERNHYYAHSSITLIAYFTTLIHSENFKMLKNLANLWCLHPCSNFVSNKVVTR